MGTWEQRGSGVAGGGRSRSHFNWQLLLRRSFDLTARSGDHAAVSSPPAPRTPSPEPVLPDCLPPPESRCILAAPPDGARSRARRRHY